MFNKIQNKIIILFVSVLFFVLLGVLLVITQNVKTELLTKLNRDFKGSQLTFDRIQKLSYARLIESSVLISEEPQFKAVLGTVYQNDIKSAETKKSSDHETILNSINTLSNLVLVDMMIVTDKNGIMLASLTEPEKYGDDLTGKSSVKNAVAGNDPEASPKLIDVWAFDNRLFQVVSVPTFVANSTQILGTLTMGNVISEIEADSLKSQTGFDVSFILDDKIVASTFDVDTQFELAKQIVANDSIVSKVHSTMSTSDIFDIFLNNERYFSVMAPVGKGANAYYLLSSSETKELAILRSLQNTIYISGIVALLISISVSIFLGRALGKPILELSSGVKKVSDGNYDVNIPVTTHDEIGTLTTSFNEMTKGLKERFHLLRYVGSHTKEMIQSSETTDVKLGGERQELTVLFSDIRGFTAYSEKISPEEVINMLNSYLSVQAELVSSFKGSVDKFVGDEMVAIFRGEHHQQRAIQCGIEIMKATSTLNEDAEKQIAIGVGINSGQVVMGNMGSKDRLDYTVIGANVNLGARLCSAAKPGQILITYETLRGYDHFFMTKELPPMSFKGFSKPVPIFEVLS